MFTDMLALSGAGICRAAEEGCKLAGNGAEAANHGLKARTDRTSRPEARAPMAAAAAGKGCLFGMERGGEKKSKESITRSQHVTFVGWTERGGPGERPGGLMGRRRRIIGVPTKPSP